MKVIVATAKDKSRWSVITEEEGGHRTMVGEFSDIKAANDFKSMLEKATPSEAARLLSLIELLRFSMYNG